MSKTVVIFQTLSEQQYLGDAGNYLSHHIHIRDNKVNRVTPCMSTPVFSICQHMYGFLGYHSSASNVCSHILVFTYSQKLLKAFIINQECKYEAFLLNRLKISQKL